MSNKKETILKGYVVKHFICDLDGKQLDDNCYYTFFEENHSGILGSSGYLNEVFLGHNIYDIKKAVKKVFEINYKRKVKVEEDDYTLGLLKISLGGKL